MKTTILSILLSIVAVAVTAQRSFDIQLSGSDTTYRDQYLAFNPLQIYGQIRNYKIDSIASIRCYFAPAEALMTELQDAGAVVEIDPSAVISLEMAEDPEIQIPAQYMDDRSNMRIKLSLNSAALILIGSGVLVNNRKIETEGLTLDQIQDRVDTQRTISQVMIGTGAGLGIISISIPISRSR